MYRAPSICQGNHTCDARTPHVCYNDADPAWLAEAPWDDTTPADPLDAAEAQATRASW